MKIKLISVVILLHIFSIAKTVAQDAVKFCGTDEVMKDLFKNNPAAVIHQQQLEYYTQWFSQQGETRQIYIIPVVFHIIHNYGTENITDAQVRDAVRILNRDYAKENADTSAIVPAFQSIAANCGIEFRLAGIDANGMCTNGIEHIQSYSTYNGGNQSKLNSWDSHRYLNIWVVKEIASGAAGYSYLPGTTSDDNDGIVILSHYVGSIGTSSVSHSRTLTHEVGHWLNLKHTWGGTNSPGVSCGDDNVGDTPETEGWTSCNLSGATCGSPLDNVQNYMEYAYCSCMFTAGQKTRMLAALNSPTAGRNNLWQSSNLAATGTNTLNPTVCIPKPDFIITSKFVCVGDPVNLIDKSTNAPVDYRFWNVPGATANSLTDSVITVSFNSAGDYPVTLYVSNNSGGDSLLRNAFIHVSADTAMFANFYNENFENDVLPNNDFIPDYSGDESWYVNVFNGYHSLSSLALNNFGSLKGTYSVVGPSFDLSSVTNPNITFHVAYCQQVDETDKLSVLISQDCGKTWQPRYMKVGNVLATAPPQEWVFHPTDAQWRMETVFLGPYAGVTNMRIKIEFQSKGGNNIYIDDINLGGYSSVKNIADENSFSIFPNPALNQLTVNSSELISDFEITDVLGRIITTLHKPLATNHTIGINYLEKGIYFLHAKSSLGEKVFRFVKL